MYHHTDGGLRNVWLANGYEIKKTPHGEGVAFHNLDGLTRSICMALTRKASLLTGAEFRYIRSAGMSVGTMNCRKVEPSVARRGDRIPAYAGARPANSLSRAVRRSEPRTTRGFLFAP